MNAAGERNSSNRRSNGRFFCRNMALVLLGHHSRIHGFYHRNRKDHMDVEGWRKNTARKILLHDDDCAWKWCVGKPSRLRVCFSFLCRFDADTVF